MQWGKTWLALLGLVGLLAGGVWLVRLAVIHLPVWGLVSLGILLVTGIIAWCAVRFDEDAATSTRSNDPERPI